ncbi:histidine phosphotransferase family protein [Alterisphingorhabdus coralli]|uniref:Histidine phosphotransferase family protein n=1 Tax=Alterisphingorhabdus coralli TaxID=3071408 RepID=A0AA97F8L2_9SPHN|nr:histidine phosphotransferase family protein [Parasphingorhabdus sp. SCSIO 66989]WOE76454.1 histidine phosphotransferase family protein [Parasphingorhabdus sp. SCSIO 66989]
MSVSQTHLASLLCSRLCHDLLSPVGAMNNGLELLAEETDPEMRRRCLDLLSDSARATAQKLKYYRLAFGAAGGFDDAVDVTEAKTLVQGLMGDKASNDLQWSVDAATLPKAAVKLLLNLALIGQEALVRGGTLAVAAEERAGQVEIAVSATGPKIAMDAAILDMLAGKGGDLLENLTARTAAAYLAHAIALEGEGAIQVAASAEQLVLGATVNAAA